MPRFDYVGNPLPFGIPWADRIDETARKRFAVVLKVFSIDNPENKSKVMTECLVMLLRTGVVERVFSLPIFIHGKGRLEWLPKESSGVELLGGRPYVRGKPVINPYLLDGSWVIIDFVDGMPYIEREFPRTIPGANEVGKMETGETFKLRYYDCEILFKDNNIYITVGNDAEVYLASKSAEQPFVRGNDLKEYLNVNLATWIKGHTHSTPSGESTTPTQNPTYPSLPDNALSEKIKGE